jgi:hypothetical protein
MMLDLVLHTERDIDDDDLRVALARFLALADLTAHVRITGQMYVTPALAGRIRALIPDEISLTTIPLGHPAHLRPTARLLVNVQPNMMPDATETHQPSPA